MAAVAECDEHRRRARHGGKKDRPRRDRICRRRVFAKGPERIDRPMHLICNTNNEWMAVYGKDVTPRLGEELSLELRVDIEAIDYYFCTRSH